MVKGDMALNNLQWLIYHESVNAHTETATENIPTKLKAKRRVLWGLLTVKKKRDDIKTASLCNKRNPTNVNPQEHKEVQS